MSAMRSVKPATACLRSYATARTIHTQVARPLTRSLPVFTTPTQSLRFKVDVARSAFARNPLIDYKELKPITQQPSRDILLVDVRERHENIQGNIPSSVNLPLSELKAALDPQYPEGDFKSKYLFSKPLHNQNIIFYCRSGKRSATAAEQAGEKGYHNVRNYQGSYLDWTDKEEKNTKSKGSNFDDDDD